MSGEDVIAARLVQEATDAYNAVNVPSVWMFVHRCPGLPRHENRGVRGLEYRITSDGVEVSTGTTPASGEIRVRIPVGRTTILHVMGTEYEVSRLANLHPTEEYRGVQQRLEMLGHHVGALHGDNRRADTYNNPSSEIELSMLDFQADHNLFTDAKFGPRSQTALRNVMRANPRGD
jgi:hypothetical protein